MSRSITLYDLASKGRNQCWSLNPWKTRLALNYKGIDYKTEWLDYPDIAPKFKEIVPPNDGRMAYTIPVVQFPDGTYVMDSRKIADQLEKTHPTPSLHLDSPYLARLEKIIPQAFNLFPEFVNKVPNRIIREESLAYWHFTRGKLFGGMPLDQVEKEKGGEKAFKAVEPFVNEVGDMLKEKKGPFFEGSQVTYADFMYAGLLRFLERIGDDLFEGYLAQAHDKHVHLELLEACRPWLKRDDY